MSQKKDKMKLLLDQVSNRAPVFFLSPHLDDAVLSCGGLISELGKKTDVTVITLFTDAHDLSATFSARRFLMHCREKKAGELFRKRREEDKKAVSDLRAKYIHLNKIDGTWRQFANPGPLRKLLGRFLPEFLHLYPTFIHVKVGRLASEDRKDVTVLYEEIKKLIPQTAVLFAPLAVGDHVDHVLTREVAGLFNDVIYWSDFPYNLKYKLPQKFITKRGLEKNEFRMKNTVKEKAIREYVTQLPSLFPAGVIPFAREVYFT